MSYEDKSLKILLENADLMKIERTDQRLEIAKAVLPTFIDKGLDAKPAVRRAFEIADEMIRQLKTKEKKNE